MHAWVVWPPHTYMLTVHAGAIKRASLAGGDPVDEKNPDFLGLGWNQC